MEFIVQFSKPNGIVGPERDYLNSLNNCPHTRLLYHLLFVFMKESLSLLASLPLPVAAHLFCELVPATAAAKNSLQLLLLLLLPRASESPPLPSLLHLLIPSRNAAHARAHTERPRRGRRRGSVHFYRVNSFAISYERTHTITSTWRKRLGWLHHSTVHAPSPRRRPRGRSDFKFQWAHYHRGSSTHSRHYRCFDDEDEDVNDGRLGRAGGAGEPRKSIAAVSNRSNASERAIDRSIDRWMRRLEFCPIPPYWLNE